MAKIGHRVYIFLLATSIIVILVYLIYNGLSYYETSLTERFYHPDYLQLKPSGMLGHGLGIIGSLAMIIGVLIYMVRKRWRKLTRFGLLKHWLEFHIFLCTLGPVLVLFHTSFKFGGLVAISFWSMVAVFLSGIIGRFIYIQIPRTIEGRQLSLGEVLKMKDDFVEVLKSTYNLDEESYDLILAATSKKAEVIKGNFFSRMIKRYFDNYRELREVKKLIKKNNLSRTERKRILRLVRNEMALNQRIDRLTSMQKLFKYWHVAHLPFALVMLVIMIIHVVVTILFGYRWIF